MHAVKWFPIEYIIKQFNLTHRRILTFTTTPSQSGPGSNNNERYFIFLHWSFTIRYLLYPRQYLAGRGGLTLLPRCRQHILQFHPTRIWMIEKRCSVHTYICSTKLTFHCKLVGWLLGFNGKSTFVGYLMWNQFLKK